MKVSLSCDFCGHMDKDRAARYCSRCGSRKASRTHGSSAHTKLSDGRVVLRGSIEEAIDKFGEELVLGNDSIR